MRVLVTGGAGFIGSRLCRALIASRHRVVVADNLCAVGSTALLADIRGDLTFVHADVRCPEDLARLPSGRWDRVYHLAASFANALSVEHPELDERTNVEGTQNVLSHAMERGCDLFVYTGSSSSYGQAPVPFEEDGPMRPETPYAKHKLRGEGLVRESGLETAVLRLFNVYGPGDAPGPHRNVVPNMMGALRSPQGRIRLTGEGTTRDLSFVEDVVRALMQAERAAGRVVNVGTGIETRIEDLADAILRLFGRPATHKLKEPMRKWDRVVRRQASVRRYHQLFDPPPPTLLSDGLRATASWLSEHGHTSELSA